MQLNIITIFPLEAAWLLSLEHKYALNRFEIEERLLKSLYEEIIMNNKNTCYLSRISRYFHFNYSHNTRYRAVKRANFLIIAGYISWNWIKKTSIRKRIFVLLNFKNYALILIISS